VFAAIRFRIYCFIGALVFLSVTYGAGLDLYDALTISDFNAVMTYRPHTMMENVVYKELQRRFFSNLWTNVFTFIFCVAVTLAMLWGVLKGPGAFKRRG
jgi:hypothetical protein